MNTMIVYLLAKVGKYPTAGIILYWVLEHWDELVVTAP